MTREELLKSPEYWKGEIQIDLFRLIEDFLNKNNMTRIELAEKLGVTKGYVSQILNGEFNHRISKLVELAMVIGKVPVVQFIDIEQVLKLDKEKKLESLKHNGKSNGTAKRNRKVTSEISAILEGHI